MRNRTQRRQDARNSKKLQFHLVVNPNLPKRSEESINELTAASVSLFQTFDSIRKQLNLNFEQADSFFGLVVNAHNAFMMEPTTTAATFKQYESFILEASNNKQLC